MSPIVNKNIPKDIADRLAQINILIVDDDIKIAAIVRKVLESLGFTSIKLANEGSRAIDIMRSGKIDMVITDWKMSPMDGISMIKYLRTSDDSPNRFMPIIMLTSNVEREHVEMARDAGITEFVIKPFSAKTLCDRIMLLIESPRGFIISKSFVGPDRRRRMLFPPEGKDRRTK